MAFLDAHCHLADSRFDGIRDEVMARSQAARIEYFIQGGVGPEDWERQRQLREPGWFLTFGLHPWFVAEASDGECQDALNRLPDLIPEAVALGELGLDFGPKINSESYSRQEKYFHRQLVLAASQAKPVVLHVVRAHSQAIEQLKAVAAQWRGIVHGFTGSVEIARAYLALGLSISVGGALVRPGYRKLKGAVGDLPLSRLVVESDAPDMAPEGNETLNEPASIWKVAEALGAIKRVDAAEILGRSRENLTAIFNLELPA